MRVFPVILFFLITASLNLCAQPHLTRIKTFGGSNGQVLYNGIVAADKGMIVLGGTGEADGMVQCNIPQGEGRIWLFRTDSLWNIQWQNCFGGTEERILSWIESDGKDGYVLFGYSYNKDSTLPCQHGSSDLWLVHTDSVGNVLEQKCYGGLENEFPYDFRRTDRGTYLVAADYRSTDGDLVPHYAQALVEDGWAMELDSQFNIVWSFQWGGSSHDQITAITDHPEGGYLLAGHSWSSNGDITTNTGYKDPWLIRLDTAGQMVWQKHYGKATHEDQIKMLVDDSGHIYLAMETNELAGSTQGNSDLRILKLDLQGNVLNEVYIGGNKSEWINDMKWFGQDIVIGGISTSDSGDVPGNYGEDDVWIAIIDTNLALLRSNHFGGSTLDRPHNLVVEDKKIKVFGYTDSDDHDFAGMFHGYFDGFLMELVSFPVGLIQPKHASSSIQIHPNPATNQIEIEAPFPLKETIQQIIIRNLAGQEVQSGTFTDASRKVVDVGGLPSGFYLVEVWEAYGLLGRAKFVKR